MAMYRCDGQDIKPRQKKNKRTGAQRDSIIFSS